MKEERDIMGMPVRIEIADAEARPELFERAFAYLRHVDDTFSTYKEGSEVSKLNRGELKPEECSAELREVLALAEQTKKDTEGYFEIRTPNGSLDPSGLVKGWAIRNAARLLSQLGCRNFYVDIGGDIQVSGSNNGAPWRVGIRSPFNHEEIVKVICPAGGVATSGTYLRGAHIWDPHGQGPVKTPLRSLTVLGPDVYEADRFATAAFAMGARGIEFIEKLPGFEGYAIDQSGIATYTSGFDIYTKC